MNEQEQPREVQIPIFEHKVKIVPFSDSIPGQTESEVEEFLNSNSYAAWMPVAIQLMPDHVMIILRKPKERKIAQQTSPQAWNLRKLGKMQ